jgi:hypothetical protein
MTPLLEYLVNERLATLRREADRERLVRAAMTDSGRGRRGPLGWFRTRRRGRVRYITLRSRLGLGRGRVRPAPVTCEENPR